MHQKIHHTYMSLALQLAEQGRFTVSPNPMVGCVIVNHHEVVGCGFHRRAGYAHAEINALHEAGVKAQGATLYVTLEPCCHVGRTPPCTESIIKAGIKKVYVASLDPNPLVAGKGIAALKAAGIEVEIGIEAEKAAALNEIFFHFMKTKRPFVIAKWAMSLDGKMVTAPNDARQISSDASHAHVHEMRQAVDAILIGTQTARIDNPRLTARYFSQEMTQSRQPLRIILSRRGLHPEGLQLLNDKNLAQHTLIVTTNAITKTCLKNLAKKNIETLILPTSAEGYVDLNALLAALSARLITSIVIEGGRQTHEKFFAARLVDKVMVYLAPVIIGALEKKTTT